MWEKKAAPLSGVLATLLLVVTAVLINNYEFMPPADEVADFYSEQPLRTMVGAYIGVLASFFVLWFAGSVADSIRRRGFERLSMLIMGGGVLASGMMILGYLANTAGAERARLHDFIDPSAAATLHDISALAIGTGAALGFAALIGGYGLARIQAGDRGWFAVASVLIAVGLISPVNYLVMGLVVIWLPTTSITLFRHTRQVASEKSADGAVVDAR